MTIPELEFSETDLTELDKIKSAADTALKAQKPVVKAEMPELGGVIHVYRDPGGVWLTGRRGSDDSCGETPIGIPIS